MHAHEVVDQCFYNCRLLRISLDYYLAMLHCANLVVNIYLLRTSEGEPGGDIKAVITLGLWQARA